MHALVAEWFTQLRSFRVSWVSSGWSWDRRFECVASTFDFSDADEAHRLVSMSFPLHFDDLTIARAPSTVVEIAQRSGGVRPGQRLFATPSAEPIVGYGLWWPWGGEGTNISMRVGLVGNPSESETDEMQKIFGVDPNE